MLKNNNLIRENYAIFLFYFIQQVSSIYQSNAFKLFALNWKMKYTKIGIVNSRFLNEPVNEMNQYVILFWIQIILFVISHFNHCFLHWQL